MTLIQFAKGAAARGFVAASCRKQSDGSFVARKGGKTLLWHPQHGWGAVRGESPEECWLDENLFLYLEDRR